MRQSGILAAAALHALDHHRDRLAEDHAHAQTLAKGLARLPSLEVNPAHVETNIVMIKVRGGGAPALAQALDAAGVRMLALGLDTLRAVTSLMVTSGDIASAWASWSDPWTTTS